MTVIGDGQARNRRAELVDRAHRGEEIVITRRSRRVAHLLPMAADESPESMRKLAQQICQTRMAYVLGVGPSVGEMVDEGRR